MRTTVLSIGFFLSTLLAASYTSATRSSNSGSESLATRPNTLKAAARANLAALDPSKLEIRSITDSAADTKTLAYRTQTLLLKNGHNPGPIDGMAGPRTAAAVRAFQATVGLTVDGRVSQDLLRHLVSALQIQGVALMQRRPPERGYNPRKIDGVPGLHACDVVNYFERDAGLASDGPLAPQILETPATKPADAQDVRATTREPAVASASSAWLAFLDCRSAPNQKTRALRIATFQAARQLPLASRAVGRSVGTKPVTDAPQVSQATIASNQDQIDDADIARALERTLVEEGGLLLPPGTPEISPEVSYTRRGSNGLRLILAGGLPIVADQDVSRDTLDTSTTLRLGLPWESQAEVRIPYVVDQEQTVTSRAIERTRNGSGLGDIEIAFSKQLLHERGMIPDVLATARWKTTTGDSNFDPSSDEIPIGTGFHAIGGSVTAVKRQDPLVFFGTISYTANLSDEKRGLDIDPGDTIAFEMGTVLSASPDSSLRFAFKQSFTDEAEVNGSKVPGSNGVQASLILGATTALSANTLLDVSIDIGVTEDAPDYRVSLSLPFRF